MDKCANPCCKRGSEGEIELAVEGAVWVSSGMSSERSMGRFLMGGNEAEVGENASLAVRLAFAFAGGGVE